MADTELGVGDVVQLNSGGPNMTVLDSTDEGGVRCGWFTKDGEYKRDIFPKKCLKLIKTADQVNKKPVSKGAKKKKPPK